MSFRLACRSLLNANQASLVARSSVQRRFISSSFVSLNNKKEESKPILTDDLLAKAGIDIDEVKNQKETESSKEEESQETRKAPKRSRAKSSTDVKRERYANFFYLGFLVGGAGLAGYLARNWEEDEDEKIKDGIPNGYSLDLLWKRFNARFNSIFTYFQEPPFPDLLPDPLPGAYRRPLTLVLTLDDLLIHSDWSAANGWRTAKRPGVDYFLGYLSQYYEIVIFSSNYMMYGERIVEKFDPLKAYIAYSLYKDHTYYKDGVHIKDLSKLNRDLSKVLIVDVDESSVKLQPENSIILPKWDGKADDQLVRLIPFFEYLATQQVKDVRPILASYSDKSKIPEEFNERVSKLRENYEKEQAKKSGFSLNSLLGLPVPNHKFVLDLIHDEGVKNYENFQKIIKAEEERLKKEAELPKETYKLKDILEGNTPTQEELMKKQLERQLEYEQQQKQQQQ